MRPLKATLILAIIESSLIYLLMLRSKAIAFQSGIYHVANVPRGLAVLSQHFAARFGMAFELVSQLSPPLLLGRVQPLVLFSSSIYGSQDALKFFSALQRAA